MTKFAITIPCQAYVKMLLEHPQCYGSVNRENLLYVRGHAMVMEDMVKHCSVTRIVKLSSAKFNTICQTLCCLRTMCDFWSVSFSYLYVLFIFFSMYTIS